MGLEVWKLLNLCSLLLGQLTLIICLHSILLQQVEVAKIGLAHCEGRCQKKNQSWGEIPTH